MSQFQQQQRWQQQQNNLLYQELGSSNTEGRKKQSIDANTEITEMLELSENDFKAAIIKMLQCNYKHAWSEWKNKKP